MEKYGSIVLIEKGVGEMNEWTSGKIQLIQKGTWLIEQPFDR